MDSIRGYVAIRAVWGALADYSLKNNVNQRQGVHKDINYIVIIVL